MAERPDTARSPVGDVFRVMVVFAAAFSAGVALTATVIVLMRRDAYVEKSAGRFGDSRRSRVMGGEGGPSGSSESTITQTNTLEFPMSIRSISRMLAAGIFMFTIIHVDRADAQDADVRPDHVMLLPDGHDWVPAPASLPPGARVMVVEGNPAEEGEFTMRLWMPADYSIAPHFHPADEHVTVISGSFYMGLGETYDEADAMLLPAGSFAMMRTGTTHFAFTTEETVVQLHGVGPWGLTYSNDQDDPRGTR